MGSLCSLSGTGENRVKWKRVLARDLNSIGLSAVDGLVTDMCDFSALDERLMKHHSAFALPVSCISRLLVYNARVV